MDSYTFTGREWDRETGMYYYRARYYDPMEGRFVSKDTIGFEGKDMVLYGYVQNNPINKKDPKGLEAVPNAPSIPAPPGWLQYCACKLTIMGRICCLWSKQEAESKCLKDDTDHPDKDKYNACMAKAELDYAKCTAGGSK